KLVDSNMSCLSKELREPVDYIDVCSREIIHKIHRMRKLLGGSMRQAGVIAAAGIVALEQMVDRLVEDHEHCKQLAHGLADYPQIAIDVESVVTNIVNFSVRNAQQPLTHEETLRFLARTQQYGVLMGTMV